MQGRRGDGGGGRGRTMIGKANAIVCRHVIIINQVLRVTVGKENGVRRARGGTPGRGAESEE